MNAINFSRAIHGILAVAVAMSSLPLWANEFEKSANLALEQQKQLADSWAEALVTKDFQKSFLDLAMLLEESSQANAKFKQFLLEKAELERKFIDFSSLNMSSLAYNTREVERLQERYDDLVRERFDLSWITTQTDAKYRQMGPLMRQVTSRFKSTCEAGRSDIKFNPYVPESPPAPPYYYEFTVSFNGQYPTTGTYKGYNYAHHKTRKDIIEGSGAVAGISGSILLSGATGATLMCASYAFPAAAAIMVTAMAVEHFENISAKNRIAGQIVRAENHKFVHTKRDDYVAEKYREACSTRVSRLERVTAVIEQLEKNDQTSQSLVATEKANVNAMKALQEKLKLASAARCRSDLAQAAVNEACVKPEVDQKTKDTAGCTIDSNRVVNLTEANPECSVALDKDNSYANAQKDRELYESIKKDEIEQLTKHRIVLAIGVDQSNFLQTVNEANWNAMNRVQGQAFAKLLQFINLARRMGKANLLGPVQAVRDEIEATKTFEGLRGRFIDVVAIAVKVTFGNANRAEYFSAVNTWEADFKSFFKTNRLNSDARSLESSLIQLKGLMNATAI